MLGYFGQEDDSHIQSYLTNAAGTTVYAGALNINGKAYTVASSAFDGGVYHLREDHVAQSLTLRSAQDRDFSWEAVASRYDYLTDTQRGPTTALPAARRAVRRARSAGSTARAGRRWTFAPPGDRLAQPAPTPSPSAHTRTSSFSRTPNTPRPDWVSGSPTGLNSSAPRQDTDRRAVGSGCHQPSRPSLTATLGVRAEHWRAFDGYNLSDLAGVDGQPARAFEGRALAQSLAGVDAARSVAPFGQLWPRLPLPDGD